MILQQLYRDADAILGEDKTPSMYDWLNVIWVINVSASGEYQGTVALPGKYGTLHLLPYNYGRSSDIVACLLADTADYAIGPAAAPDDKNAAEKHAAFVCMLNDCRSSVEEPDLDSLSLFMNSGCLPQEEIDRLGIRSKDRVTFTVDNRWPSELPSIREYWSLTTSAYCKGKPKQTGTCLITGQFGFVESVLPGDIRVGKESAPIISVNEAAGCSYGLEQACNGAVSRDAAERFTKALNKLMRARDSHIRIALNKDRSDELVYVFWTNQGDDTDPYAAINDPDPELVEKLLNSARTGKRVSDNAINPAEFFAVAITGNKTRVVFRDWLSTTLPTAKQNLARWFRAQKIIERRDDNRYYGIQRLSEAYYRRDSKGKLLQRIDTRLVRGMLHSALHGLPLPGDILSRVVVRCRSDRGISRIRAALLKTALTLHDEREAMRMETLDKESTDPAYLCGQLLALLASIQYKAQGNVNSNIIDRYFGGAVATPARILPILVKKAQTAHLPKIRRQAGVGLYLLFESEISKIHAALDAPYPERLRLEDQARFLLGYYHFEAVRFQEIKLRAEAAKKAADPASTSKENDHD